MKRWMAFLLPRTVSARTTMKNLASEPRWFHEFGVYRESPWHLAGLYNERRSAERKMKKLQMKNALTGYQVVWGKVQDDLDNFVVLDKDRGLNHPEK